MSALADLLQREQDERSGLTGVESWDQWRAKWLQTERAVTEAIAEIRRLESPEGR